MWHSEITYNLCLDVSDYNYQVTIYARMYLYNPLGNIISYEYFSLYIADI